MAENRKIKIAGLGLQWTDKYAILYKDALIDMGYETRIIKTESQCCVAYCSVPFEVNEALDMLKSLEEELSNGLANQGKRTAED